MFRHFQSRSWAVGTALAAAVAAHAMQPETPSREDGLRHASAFDGYRAYADEPVRPWAETNDEVRRIGGWRAYAREASGAAERRAGTAAREDRDAGSPHPLR